MNWFVIIGITALLHVSITTDITAAEGSYTPPGATERSAFDDLIDLVDRFIVDVASFNTQATNLENDYQDAVGTPPASPDLPMSYYEFGATAEAWRGTPGYHVPGPRGTDALNKKIHVLADAETGGDLNACTPMVLEFEDSKNENWLVCPQGMMAHGYSLELPEGESSSSDDDDDDDMPRKAQHTLICCPAQVTDIDR